MFRRITLAFIALAISLLPSQAAAQVLSQANFYTCLLGSSYSCNAALLTDAQRTEVRNAALQRNYAACLSGSTYSCNQALLTAAQATDVQRAALQRNYSACLGLIRSRGRFSYGR